MLLEGGLPSLSLVGAGTLVLGALALGLIFAGSPQKLPEGATVSGYPVGGLTTDELPGAWSSGTKR